MPKQVVNTRRKLVAGAVLLAIAEMSSAQESKALPEVKVTAQTLSEATTVISSEELERVQAKDLRDTFQNEPGISVGGGANPIAQKVYVRGVEDTMMNVSIDGARQNGYVYHHQSNIQLDPALIKTIEVDKGTSGATAGPGALAGSIRVTTKDARDLLRPGQTTGFMLGGTAMSNDGWQGQGAAYSKFGDVADLVVAATKRDIGDYKAGNGETQENSASTLTTGFTKANLYLAPGHKLTFSYNAIEDSGTRFQRPNMGSFPHPVQSNAAPVPHTLKRDTATLTYRFDGAGGIPAMEISAYDDTVENTRTGAPNNFSPVRSFGEQLKTRGLDAKLISRLGAHTLRYGLNYMEIDASAINPATLGVGGNTGKENSEVIGLFLEDQIALSQQWLWTIGGRYDWYEYTDNFNQKFKDSGFSPSTKLIFSPSNQWSLYTSYAEALRGVGLKETYLLDNAGPGGVLYRNQRGLKSEEGSNVELGASYSNGPWQAKAAIFEQTIENFQTGEFIAGENLRVNGGTVKSKGYELSVQWQGEQLRLGGSVSESKPKLNGEALNDGNMGLGTTIGRTWQFRADYAVNSTFTVGWNGRFLEDVTVGTGFDPSIQYRKPGYGIQDVFATWLPMGADKLRVTLGVYNLLDQNYYDQGTYSYHPVFARNIGYAAPGRDVRLSLNWKF